LILGYFLNLDRVFKKDNLPHDASDGFAGLSAELQGESDTLSYLNLRPFARSMVLVSFLFEHGPRLYWAGTSYVEAEYQSGHAGEYV